MIHITDSQTDIILGFIQEDEFWDDKHYKSLKDTLETYDFTTFADRDYAEHLAKRIRIIIPDEDGKYVEFVIENTRKYRDSNGGLFVEVYTSATYIELAKAKIIKPQTTPAWTAKQHAEWALAGTEWEVGDVDFSGSRTLTIEQHTNPYAYLKRLATEFDLELHFRVETDGTKVVRRYVDLIERVGVWQGREVELGKDLIGIERKEDFSNIVTALIGLGPEREDGTRLEVFVEDKDALARWGRNGQHLVEVYEPESTDQTMTEARLRELTQNELEKRINSTVEYTADIADLEKVPGLEHEKIRFGDTIKIKDTTFTPALYLEARVHTVSRSIKKNGYKTVTLGDYIEYTEEEVMAIWKSLKAEIAKKVSMSDVTEVTYTKTEIDEKDAGVYQDSTYYADNVSETKKQEAIQVAATDATNKANTAEQNAKTHADSVAEQKKQEAINAAIADAETKINTAKTELESDIALKADAEWVNGQLQLKENAIHRGATAPTDTTKLWLDTSVVPNVLKRYDSATSSWVKATPTTAGEVNAYTKTEVDNALNSKVSVTQYTTDMNGVITRLDSAESRITQTENEIATKVSNTTYQQDKTTINNNISQLQTRMSNAETSITQLSDEITLKANATEVYTKQQVDTSLANKADKTEVDSLETRVSNAEAQLTVQAGQIATKVSQTDFENGLNNIGRWTKKYRVNTDNPLPLTEFDGSPLNDLYTYEVTAKTTGTSTNTTAIAIFKSNKVGTNSGSGWTLEKIYELGTNSNHPEFFIDEQGRPSIRLYGHTTFYYVEVTHEKVIGRQNSSTVLGTRVTNAETSITQLSDQIQLKAEQTTVDTLENRISSAESSITLLSDGIQLKVDKDGVISAINLSPETAKLQASKIELDGYVEAKHIKSLNGLNVNDQFIVDSQGNVKFGGSLEGATGVFSGEIKTKKLRVRADSVHDFYDFGLEIETAQWQPDLDNPFVRTGYISLNTKNDALEIYRIDNNGNYRPLQGFLVEAERVLFTGKMELMPYHGGSDVLKLNGGSSDHVYMEFYRSDGFERSAYIGIPSAGSEYFDINAHGLNGEIRLRGRNVFVEQRLISPRTYNVTVQNPANVFVTSNGYFARSTSSKRYKADIQYNDIDYKKILNLQQASWVDRNEFKKNGMSAEGLKRYYGAIAEDFEKIGLSEFVVYNEETGEVENFSDRAWVLLIPNINDILHELEQIKERLERLENEGSV